METYSINEVLECVENGGITDGTIEVQYGLSQRLLIKWRRTPPKRIASKTKKRLEKLMEDLPKIQKKEKHPSFGYATEEQIRNLYEMPIGPERDVLLKVVERQNKNMGKR
jgi:hypothetical protein